MKKNTEIREFLKEALQLLIDGDEAAAKTAFGLHMIAMQNKVLDEANASPEVRQSMDMLLALDLARIEEGSSK